MENSAMLDAVKNQILQDRYLSVSSGALQILEDIEEIYGRPVQKNGGIKSGIKNNLFKEKLGGLRNGEVVIVAARGDQLRHAFIRQVANLEDCFGDKSVLIYSAKDTVYRLTRKLVYELADFESDIGIYDGKLDIGEFDRLSCALTTLCSSNIFVNPTSKFVLDIFIENTREFVKNRSDISFVVVDSIQDFTDNNYMIVDHHHSLTKLKELSTELNIPFIVLLKLDDTIVNYVSTLTRHELREAEVLSDLIDRYVLISGDGEFSYKRMF